MLGKSRTYPKWWFDGDESHGIPIRKKSPKKHKSPRKWGMNLGGIHKRTPSAGDIETANLFVALGIPWPQNADKFWTVRSVIPIHFIEHSSKNRRIHSSASQPTMAFQLEIFHDCSMVGFLHLQGPLDHCHECENQREWRTLDIWLGGGFNLFEKYHSNWIISPGRGENKKCLKPPPIVDMCGRLKILRRVSNNCPLRLDFLELQKNPGTKTNGVFLEIKFME